MNDKKNERIECDRVLPPSWFASSATELAPLLIGKLLCRATSEGILRLRITETECYFGEEDTACHAHHGRTPRTDIMYKEGGHAYVYLCYGIHSLLNLTTGPDGHPEAVLIRGVEGIVGPGRVTKRMQIDRSLNKLLLTPENGLWVEDDGTVLDFITSKRVGIDYAEGKDREIHWRFVAVEK
jgi:DNA-3-methyladenine glycosylase